MGISFSKLFENWDKRFETETLDEFRDHLGAAVRLRQKSLQVELEGLTDDQFLDPREINEYRMHLEDKMSEAGDVQSLADELSIVGLYKQVELHTKRVAAKNFSASEVDKLLNYSQLTKNRPFDITVLADFAAVNELRLLNNAIKHEGEVSKSLSTEFPEWVLGDKLKGLGAAYLRLMPLIKNYMQAFVSSSYANATKLKT